MLQAMENRCKLMWLWLALWVAIPVVRADTTELQDVEALDRAFQQLSHDVYRQLAQQEGHQTGSAEALMAHMRLRLSQGDHVGAIAFIAANLNTLLASENAAAILSTLSILLAHNEWSTAQRLLDGASDIGDRTLDGSLSFEFAKFHFERHQWQQCLDHLEVAIQSLTGDDLDHARLINGIVLQRLKEHRRALVSYEDIDRESDYFFHARLNTAIAYIRQGWWSEARLVIDNMLGERAVRVNNELVNRTHLVLGYAMLQREYYREARDALRNVELHSEYANRALLGIALVATAQEDFSGALAMLDVLKTRGGTELVVDEAYLVTSYVLARQQQYALALEAYHQAINYYDGRLQDVAQAIASVKDEGDQHSGMSELDLPGSDGVVLFQNSREIAAMLAYADRLRVDLNARDALQQLYRRYLTAINDVVAQNLQNTRGHLESYLSQAHYGIARIYDENLVEDN